MSWTGKVRKKSYIIFMLCYQGRNPLILKKIKKVSWGGDFLNSFGAKEFKKAALGRLPSKWIRIARLDSRGMSEKGNMNLISTNENSRKVQWEIDMERYPSHELQHQNFVEWRSYLNRFPWEWFAHLTFDDSITFFVAKKLFDRWRLRLIDEEQLRIGAYLISACKNGHIHFHVLMVGRNRVGKSLLDCDPRRWEADWKFHARISRVINNFGASRYAALNFLGFKSDHTEAESFDQTLLRQVMVPQHDGLDGFDGILVGSGSRRCII